MHVQSVACNPRCKSFGEHLHGQWRITCSIWTDQSYPRVAVYAKLQILTAHNHVSHWPAPSATQHLGLSPFKEQATNVPSFSNLGRFKYSPPAVAETCRCYKSPQDNRYTQVATLALISSVRQIPASVALAVQMPYACGDVGMAHERLMCKSAHAQAQQRTL
jgi:hypothetical protein